MVLAPVACRRSPAVAAFGQTVVLHAGADPAPVDRRRVPPVLAASFERAVAPEAYRMSPIV
jgi:hypothetical protein